MKNIYKIKTGITLLITCLFFSCNDVLDKEPLDEIGDGAFWTDPVLIEYYVNNIYGSIEIDPYVTHESRSDNSVHAQRDKWRSSTFLFNYNLISATNPNDNIWNKSYENIRKCNRFLEKIDESSIEQEKKDYYKGQVHFLRGMFYFELVKRYGGIVLLDKVLTSNDSWNIAKSSEKECYDFIINDLSSATKLLPESWNGKDKGRATKGAAWALKSRVELYDQRYEEVIKSCSEVEKLGYELLPGTTPEKYRSIWWTTNKENKEIIFDVEFKSPDFDNKIMVVNMVAYLNNPYGDRGWSGLGPTQEIVDQYELKDGSPAPKFSDVANDKVFDINTSGIYKNREPRFYATIIHHGTQIFMKGDKGPATVDHYTLDTPDKEDGSLTGYHVWKWIDYDNMNYPYAGYSGKDHALNWIMIRYAEVILNEAEARVETNDIQGALTAVNKIRSRVGLPNYTETNQNKLRELIRKERRLELAFENHRFWDVRRWRIGKETQQKLHGVKFISPTEFIVTETDNRIWDDRLYYIPIPYDEILRVSALKQNTGY
ncbi:RagB/SusD family nutrient uptake outer membrane protein [uncultured Parabacteroides sp.]|uniref:RagB/SusD family nutrient uptake outer membrane protein n=1 Tax=uncultured Parabacteroides sp. TaxID=512312 RepID=UPI002595FB67|nr:RagB/SusD family nutrient uptake outer membrane protein [uncultured Parabacteroides sp.]